MWMLCEAPESGCGAWDPWEPAGNRSREAGWEEEAGQEPEPECPAVSREQAFRLVQNLARHYGPEGPPLRRQTARLLADVLIEELRGSVVGRG